MTMVTADSIKGVDRRRSRLQASRRFAATVTIGKP
jgi:hypothetical protein